MANKLNSARLLTVIGVLMMTFITNAQTDTVPNLPVKVHHIEPLYIDLVRDLGARKGEKEINLAADFTNTKDYSEYGVLAEYEFAPIDRLGLEIETDFLFYKRIGSTYNVPGNKLESLRLSAQYSFWVSPKYNTTMALGYTQVFEFTDFDHYDDSQLVTGLIYSPFFIAAKRWTSNFYSLLFTGPLLTHAFHTSATTMEWQINPSFHYTLPNSPHFIGVEFNGLLGDEFEMVMRPQAKLQLNKELALGIVTGFPLTKSEEKFSTFFRVIYEL